MTTMAYYSNGSKHKATNGIKNKNLIVTVTLAYLAPFLRHSDLLVEKSLIFSTPLVWCPRPKWLPSNFWKSFTDSETS